MRILKSLASDIKKLSLQNSIVVWYQTCILDSAIFCACRLDVFVFVHVFSCLVCNMSVLFISFPFYHHSGAWRDSLGTDVNKLCLRKSQTQNVCEHNCIQSHMSLLVFHPCHVFSEKWWRNPCFPYRCRDTNLMISWALILL